MQPRLRAAPAAGSPQGRTQVVFGAGNPRADLMFVGEAPGFHEDKQGVPFVGQAGKLLDGLLASVELRREDVYIANVLKCRPPGNRDPQQDEIEACEPHLFRQIELIEPKVIATLGNFATKLLSGRPLGITRVHGQEQAADDRGPQRRCSTRSTTRPRRSTRRRCSRCSRPTSPACPGSWAPPSLRRSKRFPSPSRRSLRSRLPRNSSASSRRLPSVAPARCSRR